MGYISQASPAQQGKPATEKQSHAVLGSSHKSDTLEMTGRGSVDNISIRSMLKYVKDYDGNDGVKCKR